MIINGIPEFLSLNNLEIGNYVIKYSIYDGNLHIYKREVELIDHWTGGCMQGFLDEGTIKDNWVRKSSEQEMGYIFYNHKDRTLMARPTVYADLYEFKVIAKQVYNLIHKASLNTKKI